MKDDDKELQRDVVDELQWGPNVDAAESGITTRDGVETPTGGVPTYSEKVTAERVAQWVHGVRAIANDIEVRHRGQVERTDTDTAQAASNSLRGSATVPSERIKVAVTKGWSPVRVRSTGTTRRTRPRRLCAAWWAYRVC